MRDLILAFMANRIRASNQLTLTHLWTHGSGVSREILLVMQNNEKSFFFGMCYKVTFAPAGKKKYILQIIALS